MFGITRMRRASRFSIARIFAVDTPAAIEIRSFWRVTAGAISRSTGSMICGFTARITTSQRLTRSELSAAAWIPNCFASSVRRSPRTSAE